MTETRPLPGWYATDRETFFCDRWGTVWCVQSPDLRPFGIGMPVPHLPPRAALIRSAPAGHEARIA